MPHVLMLRNVQVGAQPHRAGETIEVTEEQARELMALGCAKPTGPAEEPAVPQVLDGAAMISRAVPDGPRPHRRPRG